MTIVETPIFTKRISDILTDDEYRELQGMLVTAPESGDIFPGSGGLRKIRWHAGGKGKRGGARIIYYWFKPDDMILMLFAFKKNERSDLSKEQVKQLRSIVERELL